MGVQGPVCADGNAVPETDNRPVCQRGEPGVEPLYRAGPGRNSVDVRAHADCGVTDSGQLAARATRDRSARGIAPPSKWSALGASGENGLRGAQVLFGVDADGVG